MTDDPTASSSRPSIDPAIPPGHRLVTLAEDPSLGGPIGDHKVWVWPEFMLHDTVANRHWDRPFADWPEFQACLLGPDDAIVSAFNSAPLVRDGTDADLPDGWDDQF